MLTIYTGDRYSHKLASIEVTYAWPEEKRSAYEQLDWFDRHIEEFKRKNVSIKTFSPYILNYLNLIIAEGKLNFDDLEAICIHFDEENDEYFNESLKVLNYNMVDTRLLSDPISEIYQKFNKIKNNEN